MAWHLCQRWHNKGLPCPFHVRLPEEEETEEPRELEPKPKEVPKDPVDQEEAFGDPFVRAKAEAGALVEQQSVKVPDEVLCVCIRQQDVVGVTAAAQISISNQAPLIKAIGQPPAPPSRTAPAPPVVPTKTVATVTAAVVPAPVNADEFLMGMIEEQVVGAMAQVTANNVVNAVAANTAGAVIQQSEEIGFTGEQAVRVVAGAAIVGALPIVSGMLQGINQALPNPNPGSVLNTGTRTPGVTPTIIRTVIGQNSLTGGTGGFGGFHTQSTTFRADTPVGPVGFNLADDGLSIEFRPVQGGGLDID